MADRPAATLRSPEDSRPSSAAEDDDDTFSHLEHDPSQTTPPRHQAPYRFNWPKARRGPPSMSEATESRIDLSEHPMGLGMQGFHPAISSLNLPAFPQEWSSSRTGFNAISAVLNNPTRPPAPLRPSRFPLPSVPPADLPRVRRRDYDAYINSIKDDWEKFQSNRQTATDALGRPVPERQPMSPSGSTILESWKKLPPLSTVPPVYFDPDFNLGSPRTFDSVTEQDSDRPRQGPGLEDSATNQALQDRLSSYLDVVEQHLVQEIAQRSTSFFAALSNLQDLQIEGQSCLTRIGKLRAELKEVDENQALKGLEVVRLLTKRENLEDVMSGVKEVKEVGEAVRMAKDLISAGDYFEALGMIEDLEETLAPRTLNNHDHHPYQATPSMNGSATYNSELPSPVTPISVRRRHLHPHFDLSSLKALSSLPAHLRELSQAISSSLESDMGAVLRADLTARIRRQDEPSEEADKASFGDLQEATDLRERLAPILHGLLRVKGVRKAVKTYREAALAEVKTTIKMHLPSSDAEEDDSSGKPAAPKPLSERNAALAKELREMSLEDYLDLSHALFGSLVRGIKAVGLHTELILSIIQPFIPQRGATSGEGDATAPSASGAEVLTTELPEIVVAVAEASNSRASRIVALRQEQHAVLELKDFMAVFNTTWNFVVTCETLSRRMIAGLRGTMISQSKAFLLSFHSTRLTESATLVQNETWVQIDVSPAAEHTVQIIVDSAVGDPPELSLATGPIVDSATGGRPSKHLHVEDHPYYVVSATVDVLTLVVDYLKVMANMSILITDVMARVIEFLKAFNSRVCQVVLGAGAMHSAGLKNITAKHLALASQSLSIMIVLIPYVREAFRRHLNPAQAVMLVEFDKLKRDYQEHQNEIHSKLIAIMGDRLTIHIKTFQGMKLDAPKPSEGASSYMETIVKETVTLHKVLSRYLSPAVVEYVMGQVLASINTRLGEEYGKVELPDQDAKMRLLKDAKYLSEKLNMLKGVSLPPTSMLENVVQERKMAGESTSPPPAPPVHPRKSPFVGRRAFSGLLSRAMGESKKDDPAAAARLPAEKKRTSQEDEDALPSMTSKESVDAEDSSIIDSEDVSRNDTPAPVNGEKRLGEQVDSALKEARSVDDEGPPLPKEPTTGDMGKDVPPLPEDTQPPIEEFTSSLTDKLLSTLPPLPPSPPPTEIEHPTSTFTQDAPPSSPSPDSAAASEPQPQDVEKSNA